MTAPKAPMTAEKPAILKAEFASAWLFGSLVDEGEDLGEADAEGEAERETVVEAEGLEELENAVEVGVLEVSETALPLITKAPEYFKEAPAPILMK